MLGCFQYASYIPNPTLSGTIQLSALHVDTLKYAFIDRLGYDKCQLVSNLGAVLMAKEKTETLYNDC